MLNINRCCLMHYSRRDNFVIATILWTLLSALVEATVRNDFTVHHKIQHHHQQQQLFRQQYGFTTSGRQQKQQRLSFISRIPRGGSNILSDDENETYFGYDYCDDLTIEERSALLTVSNKESTTKVEKTDVVDTDERVEIHSQTTTDEVVETVVAKVPDEEVITTNVLEELEVNEISNTPLLESEIVDNDSIETGSIASEEEMISTTGSITEMSLESSSGNDVEDEQDESIDTMSSVMDSTDAQSEQPAVESTLSTESNPSPDINDDDNESFTIPASETNIVNDTNDDTTSTSSASAELSSTESISSVVEEVNTVDPIPAVTEQEEPSTTDTILSSDVSEEQVVHEVAVEQEIFYDALHTEEEETAGTTNFDAWEQESDPNGTTPENQVHYLDRQGFVTTSSTATSTVLGSIQKEQQRTNNVDSRAMDTSTSVDDNSISNVITSEMSKILRKELKYKVKEITSMKPSIAMYVIEKKIQRPNEGIPLNWYKDTGTVTTSSHNVLRTIPKIVIPIALSILAIQYANKNTNWLDVDDMLDEIDSIISIMKTKIKDIVETQVRKVQKKTKKVESNTSSNEVIYDVIPESQLE